MCTVVAPGPGHFSGSLRAATEAFRQWLMPSVSEFKEHSTRGARRNDAETWEEFADNMDLSLEN